MLALGLTQSNNAAQPLLSSPVWAADPFHAQIIVANCNDTNSRYVMQMSSNLTDWFPVMTNAADVTNISFTVPTAGETSFYRVATMQVPLPIFPVAITVANYFSTTTAGEFVDSFDSSDPAYSTAGQWDVNKRKAGGDVATPSSVIDAVYVGQATVFGRVHTGPGTSQSVVLLGANGAVGDAAWCAANEGIQPGHWLGDCRVNIPDVSEPAFAGDPLPAVTNGNIFLNGGFYTASDIPVSSLVIAGPTTLWVQGSFLAGNVTMTNGGSLVLYLGTTASGGSGSVTFSGTVNAPGYATNLQVCGLPSLTNITMNAQNFVGTIYAPQAAVNLLPRPVSGAMVVSSLHFLSHCQFHFDESLRVTGPFR